MAESAASAVVFSIDRLGASFLGPYGNTWLETPAFCRLAADGVLLETVIADSPELMDAFTAWWSGRHALDKTKISIAPQGTLAGSAARAGLRTVLVTDDPQAATHPLAAGFAQHVVVPAESATSSAAEPADTELFRLIAAAVEVLAAQEEPLFLWIHSRGMAGAWDAPLALRQQFADEDDPEPPDFVAPPERWLTGDVDPDELLGLTQAYAGQVTLVDLALGVLLEAIDSHRIAESALFAVVSPRGYPLGEHRRVGQCDSALYSELVHVPLILRLPARRHALARLQTIAQPHQLFAVIAEECRWHARPETSPLAELDGDAQRTREIALSTFDNQRMLRTPAWHWRQTTDNGTLQHELYAKPDDRFEANEVASRCQDVVEQLAAVWGQAELAAREGRLASFPPLPELLASVWR